MKNLIFLVLLAISSITHAMELPEMSYSDQQGFLKSFPLGEATTLDVLSAYGPPRSKMDLSATVSVWTYYKYTENDVSFVIHFNEGKVYEIINRYKGFLGPTERKARELQGIEK